MKEKKKGKTQGQHKYSKALLKNYVIIFKRFGETNREEKIEAPSLSSTQKRFKNIL